MDFPIIQTFHIVKWLFGLPFIVKGVPKTSIITTYSGTKCFCTPFYWLNICTLWNFNWKIYNSITGFIKYSIWLLAQYLCRSLAHHIIHDKEKLKIVWGLPAKYSEQALFFCCRGVCLGAQLNLVSSYIGRNNKS